MNRNFLSRIVLGTLIFCGYAACLSGHGFLGNTLVKTPAGYTEIQNLKENDSVISYDYDGHCVEGRVKHVFEKSSPEVISLTINNSELYVSAHHLFYDIDTHSWVPAYKLVLLNSPLLKNCTEKVFVENIHFFTAPGEGGGNFKLYDLEIDRYHNYCVSKEDVSVHNFVPAIAIGIQWLIGTGLEGLAYTFGIATASVGLKIVYDATRPDPWSIQGELNPEGIIQSESDRKEVEFLLRVLEDINNQKHFIDGEGNLVLPGEDWIDPDGKVVKIATVVPKAWLDKYGLANRFHGNMFSGGLPNNNGNNNNNNNNNNNGQGPDGPNGGNNGGREPEKPESDLLRKAAKEAAKAEAARRAREKLEEWRSSSGTINEEKINFNIGEKIEKQMPKRSWTDKTIEEAFNNPQKTIKTSDTRWAEGGAKLDDPATAYYHKDGGYVVRNDNTGDIVQISDKKDPNWIEPWK